jgi:branched-chain amino acid transport system permease protein
MAVILAALCGLVLWVWPSPPGEKLGMFPQVVVNGLYQGSVYALIALGLTMVFGLWHIPNFAHGNVFLLGAYLVHFVVTSLGILTFPGTSSGWVFFPGLVLSMAACAALGGALYQVLFRSLQRVSHMNALIMTIGVFIIIERAVSLIWSPARSYPTPPPWEGQITLSGVTVSYHKLVVLALAPMLIAALVLLVRHTRIGKAMRAVACDARTSVLMGINVNSVALVAFGLAGALAAAAGGMVAAYPGTHLHPQLAHRYTFVAFVVVTVGGLGSFVGAILGGYMIGLAEAIGAAYTGGWLPAIGTGYAEYYGLIVLLLVLGMRPAGLFGYSERWGV